MDLCRWAGSFPICGSDSLVLNGRRIQNTSTPFNVYRVSSLQVLSQPQDITASEYFSSISTTIFSSRFPPEPVPLLMRVLYAKRDQNQLASLTVFKIDVILEYQEGGASNCLQMGNESLDALSNRSASPCLGVCDTGGILCSAKCPATPGYTGQQKASFNVSASPLNLLNAADRAIVANPLKRGLVFGNNPGEGCLEKAVCSGRDGLVECTGFRVNRAGWYRLKFRYPRCDGIDDSTCAQKPITTTSIGFHVTHHRSGADAVSILCAGCQQPSNFSRA